MLSTVPIECPEFLLSKAKGFPATSTAIVNACSLTALQSAKLAYDQNLIQPVLVGDPALMNEAAADLKWDISEIRQVSSNSELESAQIAVSLARAGEVASLMKGDIHTDQLLKAVIDRRQGLLTGTRPSHVFHMTIPGSKKSLCITDAVINVQPSIKAKLDITRNVVRLMHALGNSNPKVAVLSATEVATPSIPSSMEAAELVRAVKSGAVSGAQVDGPFAFDNAVSSVAAKLKGIHSEVAGNADVLLVPNIETGNALFKMMVYFMSAAAAGVVLGARVPIILTSRADPPAARLAAAAVASVSANANT